MRKLTVLGATGSIGLSTLDVVRRHADRYRVYALTAHRDISGLVQLCDEFRPEFVCVADESLLDALAQALHQRGSKAVPLAGARSLEQLACAAEVDVVMAAIVGSAGLGPTIAAARSGKQILLANKEALVCAGEVMLRTYHDADTAKDWNPIYELANRPEHDTWHNAGFFWPEYGDFLKPVFDPALQDRGAFDAGAYRAVVERAASELREAAASQGGGAAPQEGAAHRQGAFGAATSAAGRQEAGWLAGSVGGGTHWRRHRHRHLLAR